MKSVSRVASKGEGLDFNALETSRGKVNTEFSEIHRWIQTRKSGVLDVHRHQGRPGSPVTPPGTPNDGDLAAEVNRRRDGDDEGEEAEVKKTEVKDRVNRREDFRYLSRQDPARSRIDR